MSGINDKAMGGINYKAMYDNLRAEHRAYRSDRYEVSRELRRRFGRVEIVALILLLAGFGALACSVFFGWSHWISVAFIWSSWTCLCVVDYVRGAVTRTVFI